MYRYVDITKPSLDDAERIFGPGYEPEQYVEMFHELGPETVVLTMGEDEVLVSEDGHITGRVPARPVEIEDATGAGDAFWAGFLVAFLDGLPPARCALFAREIVELKLAQVGAIFSEVDRNHIHSLIEETPDEMQAPGNVAESERPEKDNDLGAGNGS